MAMVTQYRSHTIKSHGAMLARTYIKDWLILLSLVVIIGVLNYIEPFHRFVGKEMMEDLKFPFKPNTIPSWTVPMYAVLFPCVIFLIYYNSRRDVYDLHHAILGSFAGLGFLLWYLFGKTRAFDRRGPISKLCLVFLPYLVATLVGVSRVDDYWHHWTDVFAGAIIGWAPHEYFRTLAENGLQPPHVEIEVPYVRYGYDENGESNSVDTTHHLGTLESGKNTLMHKH